MFCVFGASALIYGVAAILIRYGFGDSDDGGDVVWWSILSAVGILHFPRLVGVALAQELMSWHRRAEQSPRKLIWR